jgi:hypothetical protein
MSNSMASTATQHLNLHRFLIESSTMEETAPQQGDEVGNIKSRSFFSPPDDESVVNSRTRSPFSPPGDGLIGNITLHSFFSPRSGVPSKQCLITPTKLSPPKLLRHEQVEWAKPLKTSNDVAASFFSPVEFSSPQATASPMTPTQRRFNPINRDFLPIELKCNYIIEDLSFSTDEDEDNEEDEDEPRYGPRRGGAGERAWWCCTCSHFNKSGKSDICSNIKFVECGGTFSHQQQMARPTADRILNHRRCEYCDPRNFLSLWQDDRREWPMEELTETQQRDLELEADIQMRKADKTYFDEELKKNMRPRQVKREFVTYQKIEENCRT